MEQRFYIALIGDIVQSRQIDDRAKVQSKLKELLEALNQHLAADGTLASPFSLTAGDEIQGLLYQPAAALPAIIELTEELFPVRLAYGIGRGPLTTNLGNNPAHLDGPCFHRARSALETAQKESRWLVAVGFSDLADELITALFHLMWTIRSQWTDRQAFYVREARKKNLQKEVAVKWGVSSSVVSESLKAASFASIQEGERALKKLLSEFGKITESSKDSAKLPNQI